MSKKQDVLVALFDICDQRGDYEFDNDLVEVVCRSVGFKNKFDVTKLDSESLLPELLVARDYAVIHLGQGRHKFIKGIKNVYHQFEPVQIRLDWHYRKSLLNDFNTSESNVLSVANNQRILHNFLFGIDQEFSDLDVLYRPKTYFPHRTKATLQYCVGDIAVTLDNVQIEIDLTIEYNGIVGVFEAKNGSPKSFSVYQIYHPFLYYQKAKNLGDIGHRIKEITCVYVTRRKENNLSLLTLWAYTFQDIHDITSIQLVKSATYRLVTQHD